MSRSLFGKKDLIRQDEFIIIDFLRFGLPQSEFRHQRFGVFTPVRVQDETIPLDSLGQPDLTGISRAEIVVWRDVARRFSFELSLPQNAVLKDLHLELCLARYAHKNYNKPIKPTVISLATNQKVYPRCMEFILPADEKWHTYILKLDGQLIKSLQSKISFFIDDGNNFHSFDEHYGCSVVYAKLFCRNHPSISQKNLREKIHLYNIANHDVILIMCPVWDVTMPPLSIACIASYLRSKKINPFIFDFNIESFQEASDEKRILWHGLTALKWNDPDFVKEVLDKFSARINEIALEIARSKARIVAFSIYVTNIRISVALSEKIKEICPDKVIVFGGPGISFAENGDILGKGWDYLVIGDGEEPLYNIVTSDKPTGKGIVSREEFVDTNLMSKRQSAPSLNDLAFIDYKDFYLNRYLDWSKLPAYTSRGCRRRCSYCFDWNYYFPYRYLKGEIAFKHLINMYNKHGRKYFEFSDLLCNGDLPSVLKMARLLKKTNKGIKWGGFAIIRHDMTESFLKELKAGGCDYLRYGFETGCEKLLKGMRRGYTLEIAKKILKYTKDAGIRVHINVLVGLPGETDDTIEETINFLRLNSASIDVVDTVNTVSLMPDTELLNKTDKFDISMDEESRSWKTPEHDAQKRREWAKKVIIALDKYNITCRGGMIEGACEGGL